MKKYFFCGILFLSCHLIKAQPITDVGIFLGGSYYVGDRNPSRQFYKPLPAAGLFVRYNINKRYAIKLAGNYFSLRGNDLDFPERTISHRMPGSFSSSFFGFTGRCEFNFFPYTTGEKKWNSTPYVFAGLGYTLGFSAPQFPSIPFGLGVKTTLSKRLSTGLEWNMYKTFNDDIDGVHSPLGSKILHNNDWYSLFGIFFTYKFFKFVEDCPVYKKDY